MTQAKCIDRIEFPKSLFIFDFLLKIENSVRILELNILGSILFFMISLFVLGKKINFLSGHIINYIISSCVILFLLVNSSAIRKYINEIKDNKLDGINVTVPFKADVIPFLDTLSEEAQITQSVNTIYVNDKKLVGHNTDIKGFELSLKDTQFDLNNKSTFILGAGGVVPSIIYALEKFGVFSDT